MFTGLGRRVESIAPDGHFFGHRAADLAGATLPIDGLDVEAIERLMAALEDLNREIFSGPHAVRNTDGSLVEVRAALCLTLRGQAPVDCVVEVTVDDGDSATLA